ncbi:hypothetical protein BD413DRAFT_595915 [Trametes elegans]|nr:hypothetical protein BD413DRAFT_595915 [Trametes elegans]
MHCGFPTSVFNRRDQSSSTAHAQKQRPLIPSCLPPRSQEAICRSTVRRAIAPVPKWRQQVPGLKDAATLSSTTNGYASTLYACSPRGTTARQKRADDGQSPRIRLCGWYRSTYLSDRTSPESMFIEPLNPIGRIWVNSGDRGPETTCEGDRPRSPRECAS